MKRYRVESRINKDDHFKIDCTEDDLEFYKALCKYDSLKNGGECYYREFPLSKNKKVFYAKENPDMTWDEIHIICEKVLSHSIHLI